jgi:hypothetical protein
MSVTYRYNMPKRASTRSRPSARALQEGGLSFKDIGNGISKAINWAKKNKPVSKAWNVIDKIVPAEYKNNPYFQGAQKVATAAAQAGLGTVQVGGVLIVHKKRTRRAKKS